MLAFLAIGACSSTGGLGSVLGSVLGQQSGNQVSGTVRRVDTRSQTIQLQQSNGQNIYLQFDNQTQVAYQNRTYPVTSLESGDQITARVQQNNNGGYYTDYVQVDQSVNNTNGSIGTNGSTTSNNVQTLQGTVRQVDRNNGWFTVETGPNVLITVSLPYNVSRTDSDRFQNLRNGDFVRFYGTYVNQSRVELRQFY
ncbi:MAG: hypothetical protein JWM41_3534 [Gemmatimonadetes bacterium]|nr:hypothetical protein [Gemmatimonadota bacterium]